MAQQGALRGITVLDLTTVIMGPYATAMLGDMGAEVIKVEAHDGDLSRKLGPRRHENMTALSMNLQRNKHSIALDLKSGGSRDVLERLVRSCDVVVTNLRPRSREPLGLTYENLRELRPDVILCSAQAYAESSARRDYPAYDDMVQAASGAASLAQHIDGEARYAPSVIADKVSGLHMVIGIMAALVHRSTTGEGQHVEIPMVDTMINFNLVEHFGGHTFEPAEGPFGWSRILVPERAPYRTADGFVCLLPYSDANWRDFFEIAGLNDLATDPRFDSLGVRHQNMGDLLALVHEATPRHTTQEWLAMCHARNIPASALLDLRDIAEDPYAREQSLVTLEEHPTEGMYYATLSPFRLNVTPVTLRKHAPGIGGDTVDILAWLGYSEAEIDKMVDDQVVATGRTTETLASGTPL
ncbi:CaiB/BaiF CoA transferase family protein [Aeromicrobium sp. CTD01-1L150]|uniref:CaiB/BaiF CoA transferase family protein n=1 Tax=Aeromicrobium sp. CTD01-1L150 TaxID=3341830 RepID=UPI0035BFA87F